jgi:3-hydroxymyristoyl/3-hydroxydecanoyl-(acyl carrier protein) dehydratase
MFRKIILTSILTASAICVFSQNKEKEDETKMVREVISVQVDKAKFVAPVVPTPPPVVTTDKHGKKKITETPPPAEAAPDTSSPMRQ